MKQKICFTLICCLLLSFLGCSANSHTNHPVTFYYLTTSDEYEDDFLSQEIRDCAAYKDDLMGLLQHYLKGPVSGKVANPFPAGITVRNVEIRGVTVHLTLSEHLVELNELEMTLACACITITTLEYTGMQRLFITATDQAGTIRYTTSLTKEDILLSDN